MQLSLKRAAAALLLACAPLPAHSASTIFGRWLTQGGDGVVDVRPCGADLCGYIVGLNVPRLPSGDVPRDSRGRPQCDLQILRAQPAEPGRWDGRIIDPNGGTAWHCTLRLDEEGHLRLRGYVLTPLFGLTQTWTPYAGPLRPDCGMEQRLSR